MNRLIHWRKNSKTFRIECMTFIIKTRNLNKEQVVEKSKNRRRVNSGKLFKIGETKRKETPPLKTKGKVSLSQSIYQLIRLINQNNTLIFQNKKRTINFIEFMGSGSLLNKPIIKIKSCLKPKSNNHVITHRNHHLPLVQKIILTPNLLQRLPILSPLGRRMRK